MGLRRPLGDLDCPGFPRPRPATMGGIAEKMVIVAMDALSNADTVLAHAVV